MDGVACALGLEELPHGFHLHELRGFVFQRLEHVVQLERLLVVLCQVLFEVAFVTQVAPVKHVRVNVAPDLGKLRHIADFAVQIGCRRDGQIRADFGAAIFGDGDRRFHRMFELHRRNNVCMDPQHGGALVRIHQLIHEAQAGHGVFGVAHRFAVRRCDFARGEFL